MIDELIELSWEQFGNDVFIELPVSEQQCVNFILNKKLINYIAGNVPRMVYLFYFFDDEEYCFRIDFEKLKTISFTDNSLKIKIGKSDKPQVAASGNSSARRYCIARSESFPDRYLSETGWKQNKCYFDIIEVDKPKTAKSVTLNLTNEQKFSTNPEIMVVEPKKNIDLNAKLKKCISCNEIIPVSANNCPYCNSSQNFDLIKSVNESEYDISLIY